MNRKPFDRIAVVVVGCCVAGAFVRWVEARRADDQPLRSSLRLAEEAAGALDRLEIMRKEFEPDARRQQLLKDHLRLKAEQIKLESPADWQKHVYQGQVYRTRMELASRAQATITDPNAIAGAIASLKDALDKNKKSLFDPLTPTEDDTPWLGAPTVPVGCGPVSGDTPSPEGRDCRQCFLNAQTRLDTVRRRFDLIQRIYGSGLEHLNALIAVGDSVKAISGFANLATQRQQKEMKDQVTNIQQSYDAAYANLLKALRESLEQIAVCENSAFGNDWYNRYGFMLYEAYAIHYKRAQ